MISISRSMLLAAALAAFPLAGVMAQSDTGKSTGPSSTAVGDKSAGAKNDGGAMKGTAPGYEDKSDVSGGVGKSPGNAAATGQSGKKPAQ